MTASAASGPLNASALRHRVRLLRPWSADDVMRLIVGDLAGLSLICVACYETVSARSGPVRTDLSWLSLGVAGLVVAGISNGIWLLRARQAVTTARVVLLPSNDFIVGSELVMLASEAEEPRIVSAVGMSRYHRLDCQLVVGKQVQPRTPIACEKLGQRPCEVCEP